MSTDQQPTDRQNLVLDEARIEAEEQAGTTSSLHPLEQPKFGELLAHARPGDAVHISEMFRRVRAPDTSSTCSTPCTATASPCAFTMARSPQWTSPPATRVPASCCPP
ncbi:hypothetical protein ACFVGY_06735 [Streptomyces sp. NPDC127106]|uniref:hypothetical protein n=1 Tax=Streptomyces sp. NPDC127106 TaxID=3345360 RepID=UPI003628935F